MKITYKTVQNSHVTGYHHDIKEKKLYIQYGGAREYEYTDVSLEEMNDILESASFGKRLREVIGSKTFKEIT